MSGEVWKKFQMTNFDMPNNVSSMKDALKPVPGIAIVRCSPWGWPRTPPRFMERVWKKFQMTNFDMPNNISSLKHALKSVTGLAEVGVLHGDGGDGPRTPSRCMEGVWKNFK